jgi:hypothetical protein
MKLRQLNVFLLAILLSTSAFSQNVPKWKFLAPLQSVSIYDTNHYMGQPTGEPVNIPIFFIYNKFGDTNYYKFEVKWNTGDSTFPEVRGFTYGDSLTIFVFIDSAKYVSLQGVNIIYKYIGVIFKSTDGGKTWKKIQLNPNFRSRKSVVLYMHDKMNGIVAQFPDSSEQFSKIWITNDGWETFREITNHNILAPIAAFYNPPKILILDLYNDLYYSSDNGQTFTKVGVLQSYLKLSTLLFLDILNDTLMFLKGVPKNSKYKQLILRTTNGGLSWEPIDFLRRLYEEYGDTTAFLYQMALDDSTIIVGGPSRKTSIDMTPKLIMSNGQNWKELSNIWANNSEAYAQYFFFKGNIVLALCIYGVFYHTIGDSTLMPPILYGKIYRIPKNFTLYWSPIEGATKYHLQIVELEGVDFLLNPEIPIEPNYDSLLFDEVITAGTSYIPQNTKNWKIYCCRIRSMNDSLVSEWNSKWYLTEPEPNDVESQIGCESTKIYPNPARENITFEQLPENVRKIKILDMLGNEVLSLPIQKSIDIEKLPAGVYYLRFEPSFEVFKFIKY